MLYGAAEFSRDVDLAILADEENLERLRAALDELLAERIFVPSLERAHLDAGLAVHFRCKHPEARNLRIDVMSKMRGVADFETLWSRRTTVTMEGEEMDILSLPDLVQAKKTQQAKDWPMLTRLIEANYFENRDDPTTEQIDFWMREMRTPRLLVEAAQDHPSECAAAAKRRSLLSFPQEGQTILLAEALQEEESAEREADRRHWEPLKRELERLRHLESGRTS